MQRVAIIEPRSAGVGLVDRAVELALAPVVVTAAQGDRSVPAAQLRRAAEVVVVDTNDDARVRQVLAEVHAAAALAAVLPGFEHYVPLAAQVAEDLALPGVSVATALRLRHKHLMREAVTAAGLDQPRHILVATEGDLAAALDAVGLPCVIKPVDQSGSLNVRKVSTRAEALAAFRTIHDGSSAYLDRPGMRLALLEEYVAGAEVSVEGYVVDGTPIVVGVTEKFLTAEPWFVEVGHAVPAALTAADEAAARAYVGSVVPALGLRMGPFHAEVRFSERGPLLMEVAARLPGDRIPDLWRLAGGADLYESTLLAHLGRPVPTAPTPSAAAAIRYVLRSELTSHGGLTLPAAARAGLAEFGTLVAPGRPVPPAGSSSNRLAYAIATAPTAAQAVATVTAADAAVQVIEAPRRHVLILNRWGNRFGEYHRYLDHSRAHVAYISTPTGAAALDPEMAEEITVLADLGDRDAVVTAAERLAARHGPFTDVLALSEFDMETGGEIRARLDVPGKLPEKIRLVRDKVAMKTAVAGAGLRVPAFAAASSAEQVRAFADQVGLPIVIKPRDGADSQDVHVVWSRTELDAVLGSIDVGAFECEEFIDGELYQIDGVVAGGRLRTVRSWHCLASCLDFATGSPFASVANDDSGFEGRVVAFAERVLAALELTDDVFHLEVFREHRSDEIVFLEIGARPGGGQVRFIWQEVYGLDLVEASVHVQLGIQRDYPVAEVGTTDVGGYLMMPEPPIRPCVVQGVSSLSGQIPHLYAETLPPVGAVLDGNGGAVHTAGTFRFRGPNSAVVEAAIDATLAKYYLDWAPPGGDDEGDA